MKSFPIGCSDRLVAKGSGFSRFRSAAFAVQNVRHLGFKLHFEMSIDIFQGHEKVSSVRSKFCELRFPLDTNLFSPFVWSSTMNSNRRPSLKPVEEFLLVAQALQNLGHSSASPFEQKRHHKRTPRTLSISVQPLDDDFQPDGEPFWLVTRDISLKGIGMISSDPIEHQFVRIGLMDESTTVIGQVRHNSSIGHKHPLYLVGIEFLNK